MPSKPTIPRVCQTCGASFMACANDVRRGFAKYCSRSCVYGHPRSTTRGDFWSHVKITDGCWLWKRGANDRGYGRCMFRGKQSYTHRVAWELTHGAIPVGKLVCHHCDVRLCCNPEHLFLGSYADNVRDMLDKGRGASANQVRHVGEDNAQSKLTDEAVAEIRLRYKPRIVTYAMLAAEFGVSEAAVSHVIHGRSWTHV